MRAAIVLVVLLAAACGGSSNSEVLVEPSTDETTDTADSTPPQSAIAYLEAFGSRDPARQVEMLDRSAAGSPAYRYAVHQVGRSEAVERTEPSEPDVLTIQADGEIDLCAEDGETEICARFEDFVTEEETGLLTDFSIDGVPIAGRTVLGSGRPAYEDEFLSVTLVSAYVTTKGGDLSVVFDTTNRSGGEFFLTTGSAYVAEDNRELAPSDYVGLPDVAPGATSRQSLAFNDAQPGGTMLIEYYVGDIDDVVGAPVPIVEGG